jgi:hypothetical protein
MAETVDPFRCRIRRVRMKGGGADVTVIRTPAIGVPNQKMIDHARGIAEEFEADMSGFFVIGWDAGGRYCARAAVEEGGPVPLSLFPSWLEEVARRELVTTRTIRDILSEVLDSEPPA